MVTKMTSLLVHLRHLRLSTTLATLVLLLVVSAAILPGIYTNYDPLLGVDRALLPPSSNHWFGTDAIGRDVFARVIYGTRQSLLGALVAVGVGLIAGTILGVTAGARRGLIETLIMRLVDVLLSIPSLLLSLAIIVLLGYGTINAAIAVGITSIAVFARMARSQTIAVAKSDFVEAAAGAGASSWQILWQHILPNSLSAVLALAAVQFGSAVLQLSTLGFLGYGAPPPTPEWGLIIADSRDFIATSWWLTLLPGLVIAAVVLAANTLSRSTEQ